MCAIFVHSRRLWTVELHLFLPSIYVKCEKLFKQFTQIDNKETHLYAGRKGRDRESETSLALLLQIVLNIDVIITAKKKKTFLQI